MKTITLRGWFFTVALVIGGVWFAGCSTTGSTTGDVGGTYIDPTEQLVMTPGLDDHDYDQAARAISDEMKKRGLPKGYVVVLGPVDTRETPYDVRVTQFQKSLQAIFNQEGTIKFMVLANSRPGETVEQAIMHLKEMNWEIKTSDDAEEAYKVGAIAKVNGILYGRVSSKEEITLDKRFKVVIYRFVWELTNTKTGLNDITHEHKIGKKIKLR